MAQPNQALHWIAWPLHVAQGDGQGNGDSDGERSACAQQAWWALRWTPRVALWYGAGQAVALMEVDRKSTRLNSSHSQISYAVFCLKKKKTIETICNTTHVIHS